MAQQKFNPSLLNDPLRLATQFGLPTCILKWEKAILQLIPSLTMASLDDAIEGGKNTANGQIGAILNGVLGILDITIFNTENGQFVFETNWDSADSIGDLISSSTADMLSQGATWWNNYIVAQEIYEDLSECYQELDKYFNGDDDEDPIQPPPGWDDDFSDDELLTFTDDPAANIALAKAKTQVATNFINQCTRVQNAMANILKERAADPSLEPSFSTDTPPPSAAPEPIFDLIFGPPAMREGQIILTSDGLYYDSQNRVYGDASSYVPTASDIGFVPTPELWKLDHFASLGGRGESYSINELGRYVDTLFDENKIDKSTSMKEQYKADHFLNVLINDKTKAVGDTSGQIQSLMASGYEENSALILNLRQSLFGVIDTFTQRINKRKKQIEIAVRAPELWGDEGFLPGEVPINDFSFLKNFNLAVDLEKQRKLTFVQGEVSSVVLPIRPKFVRAQDAEGRMVVNHLVVPSVGAGGISYKNDYTLSGVSSLPEIVPITDNITTSGLFAIYNFLDGTVLDPSSMKYQVLNCATKDSRNNCQLVGASSQQVFVSGLGIPFLHGMTRLAASSFNPPQAGAADLGAVISGVGSYLKMPNSPEFQNFLYNVKGASVDFWIHMPKFGEKQGWSLADREAGQFIPDRGDGAWSNFQYHKLVLACENTGGASLNQNSEQITLNKGSDVVRGFVMGFSRERQIYQDDYYAPTYDFQEGYGRSDPDDWSCFYMAPTQSVNQDDVAFIRNTEDCFNTDSGFYKLAIPTTKEVGGGKSFNTAKTEFMHVNVSFDVPNNLITVYLDGEVLQTASLTSVFGSAPEEPPQIPTFFVPRTETTSSFEYASGTLYTSSTTKYDNAPKLGEFFTQWMVGGGWTEGVSPKYGSYGTGYTLDTGSWGGFMGENHGIKCGLDGFIGSLKFYSKPLNKYEVEKNYDTQRHFFKNIKL